VSELPLVVMVDWLAQHNGPINCVLRHRHAQCIDSSVNFVLREAYYRVNGRRAAGKA
jgi:hypothetical protein